jgi:hypothetical protein
MNLKKTIFYVLLITVFSFTSCSDDDSSDSQSNSIVGEWTLNTVDVVSVSMGGMDLTDLLEASGFSLDDLGLDDAIEGEFGDDYIIEFKSDNTVILSSDEEMEEGTYSISGDVLTINSTEEESITFIIKTFDDSSLVLTQQEELDFTETDLSNPLLTQPVEIEVDLSFNRL